MGVASAIFEPQPLRNSLRKQISNFLGMADLQLLQETTHARSYILDFGIKIHELFFPTWNWLLPCDLLSILLTIFIFLFTPNSKTWILRLRHYAFQSYWSIAEPIIIPFWFFLYHVTGGCFSDWMIATQDFISPAPDLAISSSIWRILLVARKITISKVDFIAKGPQENRELINWKLFGVDIACLSSFCRKSLSNVMKTSLKAALFNSDWPKKLIGLFAEVHAVSNWTKNTNFFPGNMK